MPSPKTLADLGWNDEFENEFAPFHENGWLPARLIRDNKISYGALLVEDGGFTEVEAVMSGKVYHDAQTDAELPAVGDWVALDLGSEDEDTMIRARLKRQTCFSRRAPGESADEQVIAANVSMVAVVTDPGPDFNLRRMERYFALIGRSGAKPLVLVNKADLYSEEETREAAQAICALLNEVKVIVTSAEDKTGIAELKKLLAP